MWYCEELNTELENTQRAQTTFRAAHYHFPDHFYHVINCSLYHCQMILKIPLKAILKFLSSVVNRQIECVSPII